MEYKEKTTIVITQNLNGLAGKFSYPIYCPFLPDEVVVSNMNYFHDGTEAGFSRLSTSMINSLDSCIGIFQDGENSPMQSSSVSYSVGKPVRGDTEFFYTIPARAGTLVFTLTFIKK